MNKSSQKNSKFLAGLDIGTTKISFVIGSVQGPWEPGQIYDWSVNVVGLGVAPSHGIRQGAVVNVEATIDAIKRAREEAELMAGEKMDEVYVSIGGTHIKSFDSRGMVAIRNKEVRADDVTRVIEAAKAVAVPADREVLHILPREYKLDDQEGIFDPIGMNGVRLEANVHLITAGRTALQNAIKCTEKAGLRVKNLVLQQLASSLAVLSEDEKKLGVAVVDIGGGSSEIVVYVNGSVAYTGLVPVGGMHFTQDISMGLRTPQTFAESIKKLYGAAIADLVDRQQKIEVEGVGGRDPKILSRRELCNIIEPRAEETLGLIHQELRHSNLIQQIGSGVVLTGGGADLEGIAQMGEFIFEMPVRKGLPQKVGGLTDVVRSPMHSTAVGLLLYALEKEKSSFVSTQLDQGFNDLFSDFTGKMKVFFGDILKS